MAVHCASDDPCTATDPGGREARRHRRYARGPSPLLLAACSSGSDGTERQVKTAATAAATAQTALSAWLTGDAPADYARETARTMRERLTKAAEEVAASEAGGAARRAALLNPMRQAGAALGRAEAAVEAGDRGDAERARAEAATAASSFTAPAARNRPPPR